MKKRETFWPCMGSTGSISALVYILFLSILHFSGNLSNTSSHGEVYNSGFKCFIQPVLASAFIINSIIVAWRFKTILPVIGFIAGLPFAVFIVGIAGRIGMFFSNIIRISTIHHFSVSLIVQIILAGALAARGLSDIIKLYKNPNQRLDPIVKTPVDEVEAQGTQGHP
jgi:hypothetical protein